jgi:hypothetical protein
MDLERAVLVLHERRVERKIAMRDNHRSNDFATSVGKAERSDDHAELHSHRDFNISTLCGLDQTLQ